MHTGNETAVRKLRKTKRTQNATAVKQSEKNPNKRAEPPTKIYFSTMTWEWICMNVCVCVYDFAVPVQPPAKSTGKKTTERLTWKICYVCMLWVCHVSMLWPTHTNEFFSFLTYSFLISFSLSSITSMIYLLTYLSFLSIYKIFQFHSLPTGSKILVCKKPRYFLRAFAFFFPTPAATLGE